MKKSNIKITFLSVFIILAGALLLTNVLLLDLKGENFFSDVNFKDQVGVSITSSRITAERGNILDSEGNILASDKRVYKIIFILSNTHKKTVRDAEGKRVVVDDYVSDPRRTAKVIAEILNGDEEYIYGRLTSNAYQVEIGTIGSNLSYDTRQQIEEMNLPGITFESSIKRYYPQGAFASHLIGYTKMETDSKGYTIRGISGIEGRLNEQLSGSNGLDTYYSDVNNNIISGGTIEHVDSVDGYDVKLTINPTIQESLDETLGKIMKISDGVDKAWSIVMDAKTGAIYGYDSFPTFDPNTMQVEDYNDYCATLPYEPGSTMKTITYAAAIDLGHFNKDALFNSNNYYVGTDSKGNIKRVTSAQSRMVIHNSNRRQYGMVSFYRGYVNSYNTGTVTLLEEQIGKENFEKYVDSFGFYKPVNVYGIDEGTFFGAHNYDNVFSLACATFGSGMSCTALQMIQAYTAFTNQGTMVKPYIVDSVIDKVTGEQVYKAEVTEVGTPIKASTADQILELMNGLITSDLYLSAKWYLGLDDIGISVGCKTGTAPVANEQGIYDNKTVIHSLMITFPIEDPKVLIYIAYQDDNMNQNFFKLLRPLELSCVEALGINRKQGEVVIDKEKYTLENLTNHSLDYVDKKYGDLGFDIVKIGQGDTVIRQYPLQDSTIITGQRLFVLTGNEGLVMPDMTGYSRSEVMAFWDLTGIAVKIEGYGYVTSQSIEPGTPIDKTVTIGVKLN